MEASAAADTSTPPMATRRERVAWYLYDFGNSAYAAVVLLAIYSAYFQSQVAGGARGSRLWGISVGIAMFAVAFSSPIFGAVADHTAAKKRFLLAFTALAVVFTALLFFVGPGDVALGMAFFILAEVGYRSAQVFYNALLPEIASPEEISKVSGLGWAIGSAGGILCLVLILSLIQGIGGSFVVRLAFPITALYYAIASAPIFLQVSERATPRPLPEGQTLLSIGFKRLAKTFRRVRQYREFLKFMIAFLVYNDGIIMALDFAAILGAVLYGLEQDQLILFMILVQVTSVAGAYLFGLLADRFSPKRSLLISLILMSAAVIWLFFNRTTAGFYMIGSLAGFALTGVQSVSRTMIGLFSPPGQSGEFYGFFAVTGRTSSFIGPALFGVLAAEATFWFQRQGLAIQAAEQAGHRWALLSILLFLVIGSGLLLSVNEERGRAQAGA